MDVKQDRIMDCEEKDLDSRFLRESQADKEDSEEQTEEVDDFAGS
jgi:hypothetical protein